MTRKKHPKKIFQRGSTLLIAILLLSLLGIVTLAATRSSVLDILIASNAVLKKTVWQGAESALAANLERTKLILATTSGTANANGFNEKLYQNDNLGQLAVRGQIEALGIADCPVMTGIAMSNELSLDSGGLSCMAYRVTGHSRIKDSAIRDSHVLGVMIFIPAQEAIDINPNNP